MKLIKDHLFLLIFICTSANASHFMGGQITYKCVGINQYHIVLKLYRDCNGCNPQLVGCTGFTDSVTGQIKTYLKVIPSLPGGLRMIDMNLDSINDITPKCRPTIQSVCENPNSPYPWGIEEYIFENTIYIPPSGGPYFFSHEGQARNAAISTIQNPASTSWYIGASLDPTANCNSSPNFLNPPTAVACKDEPFTFNNNAFDTDGDSLVYSFVPCMESRTLPVNYIIPYSATTPLSASTAFVINQQTGEISFTPDMIQIGIMSIQVEEFRNGVKIGEVIRDLQIIVLDCDNQVPSVRPLTNSGGNDTTVFAGTPFCIPFKATDQDFTDPQKNVITLSVTSGILPPATWSNPPPQGVTITGDFCWTPGCEYVRSQPYIVTVIAQDNACPIPGNSVATFEIYVENPIPTPPALNCISVVNNNLNLLLEWEGVANTKTISKYFIYRASNLTSGFVLIDSVDKDSTNYIDQDLSLNLLDSTYYYFLTSKALCKNIQSISSDTVSSIRLRSSFSNPVVTLNWNTHVNTFSPLYRIKRFNGLFFYQFDTTKFLNYLDTITSCTPKYLDQRIDVINPFGNCISSSNTIKDTVPGKDFPPPPSICKAEVNLDNSISLFYSADSLEVRTYYIYRYASTLDSFLLIDSVTGSSSIFYKDNAIDGSTASFKYKMSVKDTCDLYSKKSNMHKTINVKAVGEQLSATINWSRYIGWVTPVDRYIIYRGKSFPLTLVAATTDTGFIDTFLSCNVNYIYRIMAIHDSGGSCDSVWSDTVSVTPKDTILPEYPEICNISVGENYTDITIEYTESVSGDADSSFIWKMPSNKLIYTDGDVTGINHTFIDPGAINQSNQTGCYQLSTNDTCGNFSNISPTFCTIDLSSYNGFRENHLAWPPFTVWQPDEYRVYGGYAPPFTLLGSTTKLEYTHTGIACDQSYIYRIEAVRNSGIECISSFSDTTIAYCADIQFPNTFTPNGDGYNDYFKPIIAKHIGTMYFKVFNRWGNQVFSTNEINIMWDGTAQNGIKCKTGVYYYIAEVELMADKSDKKVLLKGWIHLFNHR